MLSNFPPTLECVKGLARRLREILFGKGALDTRTPTDSDTLYKPMIATSEDAIQALDW